MPLRGVLQKTKHLQLHSRIIRFLAFDSLTEPQIQRELLPQIAMDVHITFDPNPADATEIVAALFAATQGNFRKNIKVLSQANERIGCPSRLTTSISRLTGEATRHRCSALTPTLSARPQR